MTAQSHRSDPRILDRRTLQRDHRHLAGLLRPGLSVLDIGCGTGAITAGIAEAVGPQGYVVGIDRDEGLLERARAEHGWLPNLRFERGDATALSHHAQFDIVTAARTLQWISELDSALSRMKQAAKPGGMLVVLDYNHAKNRWEPPPPREFCDFYKAFLAWREARQWDNHVADHLPELFRSLGLADVESHVQDEIIERGGPEFAEHADIASERHTDEKPLAKQASPNQGGSKVSKLRAPRPPPLECASQAKQAQALHIIGYSKAS